MLIFTDCTIVNHNVLPPFGRICLELFLSMEEANLSGFRLGFGVEFTCCKSKVC